MKKIIFWVVGALLLAGLIGGATLIYNDYIEENRPSNIVIVGGKGDRTEAKGEATTEQKDAERESDAETNGMTEAPDELPTDNGTPDGDTTSKGDVEQTVENDGDESKSPSADRDTEDVTEEKTERQTEDVTEEKTEKQTEETTEKKIEETETESPYLAADFTVYDRYGKAVKLSDFRGKPIVLNFWASDCYYCALEMPDFQAAYEKYGDEVEFLMVCFTSFANRSVAHEQSYIDRNRYTFPVYFDTSNSAVYAYGIDAIPQTFFIDRSFDIYTYIPGMADAESLELCIGWILE